MPRERVTLPKEIQACQKSLLASDAPRAFATGSTHAFGPLAYPGTRLDEDVFDDGELWNFGLRRPILNIWPATVRVGVSERAPLAGVENAARRRGYICG